MSKFCFESKSCALSTKFVLLIVQLNVATENKMSFVAILCHFCEEDGPTVLLTTYTDSSIEGLVNTERSISENLKNLPYVDLTLSSCKLSCRECRSLSHAAPFIVTSTHDRQEFLEKNPRIHFVSSRLPPGIYVNNIV